MIKLRRREFLGLSVTIPVALYYFKSDLLSVYNSVILVDPLTFIKAQMVHYKAFSNASLDHFKSYKSAQNYIENHLTIDKNYKQNEMQELFFTIRNLEMEKENIFLLSDNKNKISSYSFTKFEIAGLRLLKESC